MKRAVIAFAVLALLCAGSLLSADRLGRLTEQITGLLTRAEEQAEAGNWAQAEEQTLRAQKLWQDRQFRLHVTLNHADVDEVDLAFGETLEFLECREGGEYSSANAKLIGRLDLLAEEESLTWENIL